ncbi:MAG: hypothetical protein ABS81_20255 [Pseudonocardia sp. SCN 72-86]|nr:MAG: hypothetical protein ABS81_20255 [Pseudonocardia sp. SCN 72-86]
MSGTSEVTVRGYRTRIVDEGRGAPMLLVHGTPLDLTSWDGVVAALPGRRTVRYDVRGHGAAEGSPVSWPACSTGMTERHSPTTCGVHPFVDPARRSS